MLEYLTTGVLLGLSAGLAPGPLLTLVITETLSHDLKAGATVALAPVITDLPIVLLTLWVLARLSHFTVILGLISMLGGLLVFQLGYEHLHRRAVPVNPRPASRSLRNGVWVNFLNPHPYLFWFGVGAPLTLKAMDHSMTAAAGFIGGFYVMLVGSKLMLALTVAKSRPFLNSRTYLYAIRGLGVSLCLFAAWLIWDGLALIGPAALG